LQGSYAGLGSQLYFLEEGESWGLVHAINDIQGLSGVPAGSAGGAVDGSLWDYAAADAGASVFGLTGAGRPAAYAATDAKELAAAKSLIAQMPPQSFWDAYGYNITVAKVQAGDYSQFTGGLAFPWTWQPSLGGAVRASNANPVATVDTLSKGVEFELVAQPTKNWMLSVNASKTDASRENLNAALATYILRSKTKYDSAAGDVRLWGPYGQPIRNTYYQSIYYPYQFLLAQSGTSAPEIRPWRFNAVTNYAFDQGVLKGANVGLGYRYQQGEILGYGLSQDSNNNWNLDVSKPFRGKAEDAVDLWAGYERKLTHKIGWRIQLNLQGVGQKTRLVPLSIEPDGSPGAYRIREGMGWKLTNTLTF
jgi:hypothetical protein